MDAIMQPVVACNICLREVPASEAASAEASDYVAYIFGWECYATWHKQAARVVTPETESPSSQLGGVYL